MDGPASIARFGSAQLVVERRDGGARVRVSGDVDLSNADLIGGAIRDMDAPGVVLDLRQVGFMDSFGLRLLVALQHDPAIRDLRLVAGRGTYVGRLVELAGLDWIIRVAEADDGEAQPAG
jgi:anti-anti-sigma factor